MKHPGETYLDIKIVVLKIAHVREGGRSENISSKTYNIVTVKSVS